MIDFMVMDAAVVPEGGVGQVRALVSLSSSPIESLPDVLCIEDYGVTDAICSRATSVQYNAYRVGEKYMPPLELIKPASSAQHELQLLFLQESSKQREGLCRIHDHGHMEKPSLQP
ncbi:MAG: hypothetical protein ACLUEK_05600 [Oscillospiraceae bacterium]